MLDRHSALAVPDESYFIPQLAERHRGPVDPAAFVDDLRRLPTVREWGVDIGEVASRLRPGMSTGEAIGAVYVAYAAARGKERWGDKTPLYMQHLPLLERLFPEARYVHLIRDGRDAAVSFLQMPAGVVTRSWAHLRDARGFACQWRSEVRAAQALGRRVGARYLEVRYEALVADPEQELRRIAEHGGLTYEREMLDYPSSVDVSDKPHQQRLRERPTVGVRNWRSELAPGEARAFSSVAGDLLAKLGYDDPGTRTFGGRLREATYQGRIAAWNATGSAVRRSPFWRRRHPPLV
jgi:hypothetical protein